MVQKSILHMLVSFLLFSSYADGFASIHNVHYQRIEIASTGSFPRNEKQTNPNKAKSTDTTLYAIKRYGLLPANFTDIDDIVALNLESQRTKSLNEQKDQTTSKWMEKLLRLSNIASLLCVLDCTILPIAIFLLPLLGMGGSPSQAKFFHDLGHTSALYFVLPVGGFAGLMNFMSHKSIFLFLFSVIGLSLIYLANVCGGPILSLFPHTFQHSLHCGGFTHRIFNIIGCMLLLGSNHYSRRRMNGCAFSWMNIPIRKTQQQISGIVCCRLPWCKNNKDNDSVPFFSWN